MEVEKREDGRYYKPCPQCGEMQSYAKKGYATRSLMLGKLCKKCSNRKTENSHRGWINGIRVSWFNKYKLSAEVRNLEFSITPEYVANLYQEQNHKCALSGIELIFPDVGLTGITASLDRINSNLPYIEGNIQIVHKHINMMKQQHSNDYFIEMCKKVAQNCKW